MQSRLTMGWMMRFAPAAAFVGALTTLCGARAEPTKSAGPTGAQSAPHPAAHGATKTPEAIAVPEGQHQAFELEARGVQIYRCNAAGDAAPAWTLEAPDAELRTKQGKPAGSHGAGPNWTSSDGSKVNASKLRAAEVDPKAVPWLLLQATTHEGNGRMANVSFIQRLNTQGGLAPSTGCDAAHLGATTRVPYSATYAFYEPKPPQPGQHPKHE